jgi:hypothetical protein
MSDGQLSISQLIPTGLLMGDWLMTLYLYDLTDYGNSMTSNCQSKKKEERSLKFVLTLWNFLQYTLKFMALRLGYLN